MVVALGDSLPFEVARWVVPRLPRSMQRFTESSSWATAVEDSVGYDRVTVENRNESAARLAPISGNDLSVVAAFGVALAHIGNVGRAVRVVDFGGADGRYLALLETVFPAQAFDWTVVELPDVVESMRERSRPGLTFSADLEDSLAESADIVFASAALNYVPEPMGLLDRFMDSSSLIILTRLPLWPIPAHRVAVQRPQRKPVEISYPTWFFSECLFLEFVTSSARVLFDLLSPDDRGFFAGHYGRYRALVLSGNLLGGNSAR